MHEKSNEHITAGLGMKEIDVTFKRWFNVHVD